MSLSGNRGLYSTACEQSPHRQQIDKWMNEGKSNAFISRQLANLGEEISDKSIAKYRKYRDEHIERELMQDPIYQAKIQTANQALIDEVSKVQHVDVLKHLADAINYSAELIDVAKTENLKIKNVQDLRFVQMSMLEALKMYTETIMKAQQYQKIEENPELLKPTVTVNVKNLLVDMMGGMTDEQRFAIIDRIRTGAGQPTNTNEDDTEHTLHDIQ